MSSIAVAENLRHARTLGGLGQRELDRLAHRTEGHCGLIESRSDSDVHASTIVAYADVLGLTLDWLVVSRGPAPQELAVKAAIARAQARAENRSAASPPPPVGGRGFTKKASRGKGIAKKARRARPSRYSQKAAA